MVRKICVGTITRQRPIMLASLLESYAKLNLPQDTEVSFLIVENNHEESLATIIENFRKKVLNLKVIYFIEPTLGIAQARNAVLNYAVENGYDLLTFADDDEVVETNWLIELLKELDDRQLDIVGSPVRIAPPKTSLSWWQKQVWRGLNDHNKAIEARNLRRKLKGKDSRFILPTGSWMGRLDFFRETGLRFDVSLGLAGGEDSKLCGIAQSLGAKTGWSPNAIAYETVPPTRLALKYYYKRRRDESRTNYSDASSKDRKRVSRLFGSLFSRFYKVIAGILMFPLWRNRSLITCAYHSGSFVGILQGCRGKGSKHYNNIDGH